MVLLPPRGGHGGAQLDCGSDDRAQQVPGDENGILGPGSLESSAPSADEPAGWPQRAWTAAWCAIALAFPWSNAFMSVATALLGGVTLWTWVSLRHHRDEPVSRMGWPLMGLVMWIGLSALWSQAPLEALDQVRVTLPLWIGGLAAWVGATHRDRVQLNVARVMQCAAFSAMLATASMVILDVLDGAPFGGRAASRFISHIRFGLWWAVLLPWAVYRLPRIWGALAILFAGVAWSWTESLTGLIAGGVTAVWWAPMMWRKCKTGASRWPIRGAVGHAGWHGSRFDAGRGGRGPPCPGPARWRFSSALKRRGLHASAGPTCHREWASHLDPCGLGELAQGWRQRSEVPLAGAAPADSIPDLQKPAKGWPGVAALTEAEVEAIESGYASVVEWRVGWAKRWNRICFNWGQWLDGRRTADASLLARSVYQRTAWEAFERRGSRLGCRCGRRRCPDRPGGHHRLHRPDWAPEDRHRPHQQYLSLVLALGLVGLILWLWALGQAWRWREAWPAVLVLFERVDRRHAADASWGHIGLVVLGPARVVQGAFCIALRTSEVDRSRCPLSEIEPVVKTFT